MAVVVVVVVVVGEVENSGRTTERGEEGYVAGLPFIDKVNHAAICREEGEGEKR